MIYIDNNIRFKVRSHLKIHKSKEIKSTLIEIIEAKSKYKIICCIYKHLKVCISEFTNDFINPQLEKLATENKEIILMDYYNIIIFKIFKTATQIMRLLILLIQCMHHPSTLLLTPKIGSLPPLKY